MCAVVCSCGLAYSTMHYLLHFRKVYATFVPRGSKSEHKISKWVFLWNTSVTFGLKERTCSTGQLLFFMLSFPVGVCVQGVY